MTAPYNLFKLIWSYGKLGEDLNAYRWPAFLRVHERADKRDPCNRPRPVTRGIAIGTAAQIDLSSDQEDVFMMLPQDSWHHPEISSPWTSIFSLQMQQLWRYKITYYWPEP